MSDGMRTSMAQERRGMPVPSAVRTSERAPDGAGGGGVVGGARGGGRAGLCCFLPRGRRGDRAAFGCLYRRHARVVHGVLLARHTAADAEDLVQEVFTRAMMRMGELRDPGAFVPWMAALARNASVSWLRSWWQRRVKGS